MTSLAKRVSVAVIGVPLILLSIYFGGIYFIAFAGVVSIFTLYEVYDAAKNIGAKPNTILGCAFSAFAFINVEYFNATNDIKTFAFWCAIGLFVIPLIALIFELFSKKENAIHNVSATLAGILMIVPSFLALALLRNFDVFEKIGLINGALVPNFGLWIIVALFVSIWSCDTFAYFFGKSLGKHKIMPRVSPNKSWEGSIAGFIFGAATFALISYYAAGLNIMHAVILGAIIGVIGQIGDLAESHLKRDAKIKDSGTALPGHGGFWDRFDSIIFAAPTAFVYLLIALF